MNEIEIQAVAEWVSDNSLVSEVEIRTRKNWHGVGSRATWYNAIKKTSLGECKLVESLMLQEAMQMMRESTEQPQTN